MKKLLLVVLGLSIVACGGSERLYAQRSGARLAREKATPGPGQPIPMGFKTYSLFLVCNQAWLAPDNSEGLHELYQRFWNFGRTIGDDNLAVWFRKSAIPSHYRYPWLAQDVDVERSVRFCTAWKLEPSAGPHVVVTSTYPDETHLTSGLPEKSAVYELGNMSSKEISALLAGLTDKLIEGRGVEPVEAWVRLLAATQRTINKFGCAWRFEIHAGPVIANLHSCQTQ
jgi:hypothetical protein